MPTNSLRTASRCNMSLILYLWILSALHVTDADMTCEFPDFMQSPEEAGVLQAWNTRRWWLHLRHKPTWAEKQQVYVQGSHMWRHREQILKACQGGQQKRSYPLSPATPGPCTERQLVYNRTCITVHGASKFRVLQYNTDRTHSFSCMRFIRQSDNIVQVYEGHRSESNDDDLCNDDKLQLDDWPWVAEWGSAAYFCPVQGGFTFRTTRRLTNEDFCEGEWRRSRLEMECVRGDGLYFSTPPGAQCNPFDKHDHVKRLSCWAGWEDGAYIFLVAADNNEPRFCLRFPKEHSGEFTVLVYFSVICPTEKDGKPPHGIEYYELRMRRKEPLSCEDDDALQCQLVASNGQCSSEDHYAQHCPKACGLCSEAMEESCWFDPRLYGDWMLYEADRREEVFVDRSTVSFSLLGHFRCQQVVDEARYRYKTTSRFRNGCSDRFTCFEFNRRNNNLLQYRVGRSYWKDGDPETICQFGKDEFPLDHKYRSQDFKNLVLARDLWPSYCGFNANLAFNGTFNGELCEGELGDWAPDTCTIRGTLVFRATACTSLIIPQEFQCLSLVQTEEGVQRGALQQQLITRSMDGKNEYNCWILTSAVEGPGPGLPYRIMYRMPTTQCSLRLEAQIGTAIQPRATVYLNDRLGSKMCHPDQERQGSTQAASVTYLRYLTPDEQAGRDQLQLASVKPRPQGVSPTPAKGLSQETAGSPRLVTSVSLCLLVQVTLLFVFNCR